MDVQVIEVETSRLLATYPISLGGLNYRPSEQEYFAEAWRCAVEDKLVDADHPSKYVMRLAPNEQ